MSITLADEVAATVYLLRGEGEPTNATADTYLEALHELAGPTYIGTKFLPEWGEHGRGVTHNCIIVQGAGGFGKNPYLPITVGRVDIKCYSRQNHVARRMALLVGHLLSPPERIHGWVAANTRVIDCVDLTNPMLLTEPDTNYLYTLQSGNLRFREIAVTGG